MIKILITILLLAGFSPSTNAKPKKNKLDVSIEDSCDYSKIFLQNLKNSKLEDLYKSINLKDSLVILDNKDTVYFPERPKLKKMYFLKSSNRMWVSELRVERINQTSIEYMVAYTDRLGYRIEEKGIANLNPSFVLGSEIDDVNGIAFAANEYSESDGKRFISIKLGVEDNSDSLLMGRVFIKGIERCSIIKMEKLPIYKEDED